MAGEIDFIAWLRRQSQGSSTIALNLGDDLAALRWNADDLLLVGADQVLDGIHFDSRHHAARDIGRKAMNRNLSDCAAMACAPAAAVATVALPRGMGTDFAKELYMGMRDAADPFDCPIVGGDTASWDGKLVLSVTILGASQGITPVTRSGGKVGDGLYVSGALGGSILGRHLRFEPRVALSRQLATSYRIHAMIDLSDGLSRDLCHICEQSAVGAIIEASRVPIHDEARIERGDRRSALEHALHDGEDYELLIASPDDLPGCWRIGRLTQDSDVLIEENGVRSRLQALAWEHAL